MPRAEPAAAAAGGRGKPGTDSLVGDGRTSATRGATGAAPCERDSGPGVELLRPRMLPPMLNSDANPPFLAGSGCGEVGPDPPLPPLGVPGTSVEPLELRLENVVDEPDDESVRVAPAPAPGAGCGPGTALGPFEGRCRIVGACGICGDGLTARMAGGCGDDSCGGCGAARAACSACDGW